jgi:hypothetical protein
MFNDIISGFAKSLSMINDYDDSGNGNNQNTLEFLIKYEPFAQK